MPLLFYIYYSFKLIQIYLAIDSFEHFNCISPYSALEDSMPDQAITLFTDACTLLEEDGREQMAFDLYRDATSVFVKLEK